MPCSLTWDFAGCRTSPHFKKPAVDCCEHQGPKNCSTASSDVFADAEGESSSLPWTPPAWTSAGEALTTCDAAKQESPEKSGFFTAASPNWKLVSIAKAI